MWRKREILEHDESDGFDREVCEHFNPLAQYCPKCDNDNKNMNKEELDNLRNKGPCACDSPDCWYCAAIGDFKFQWVLAKAERDIYANQLERALAIADALSEYGNDPALAEDWRKMLANLVCEVKGKPKQTEENVCEI